MQSAVNVVDDSLWQCFECDWDGHCIFKHPVIAHHRKNSASKFKFAESKVYIQINGKLHFLHLIFINNRKCKTEKIDVIYFTYKTIMEFNINWIWRKWNYGLAIQFQGKPTHKQTNDFDIHHVLIFATEWYYGNYMNNNWKYIFKFKSKQYWKISIFYIAIFKVKLTDSMDYKKWTPNR